MANKMKFLLLGFCIGSQLNILFANNEAQPAMTYKVDLGLPPIERWNEALNHFDPNDVKLAFNTLMNENIPSKFLISLAYALGSELEHYIPQPFADELRGVSKALDMPIGEVVLANLVYDITAFNSSGFKACTSIVARDKNNRIIHGRNLDYDAPKLLKPLTFQAQFVKSNETVFMATTYAGYIGIITGTRPGAFSITGDERDKGKLWQNLLSALEESWPTFFLQRMVLERAPDYKSALEHLIKVPTIAPVYYIVGGISLGEGAIIVKNRRNVLNVTSMGKNWYVLETNYDPWTAPPASDDRRDAGIAAMNKVGQKNMDYEQLYKVLSSRLVFNENTTYTTIMSASDASAYSTMIRYDDPPIY